MEQEILNNRGVVKNSIQGWHGYLNVAGVTFDVNVTFWKDDKGEYIWIQRDKVKVFDKKTSTFRDIKARPHFECYARSVKKKEPNIDYRGTFYLASFKFNIIGRWDSKFKKTLSFIVERAQDQPLIKRINELMKEE